MRKKVRKTSPKKTPTAKKPSTEVGWVALELTTRGESEKNINHLLEIIRKNLQSPTIEIFVPIYYENEEFYEKNVSLFTGYFFIRFDEKVAFHKLKDSKFFEGVVCDPATKAVKVLPDSDIQSLKDKFNKILSDASNVKVGQTVTILDGLYKNLTGKVTKVHKKQQMCIIKITSLKSRKIEVSAPFMGVSVVAECDEDSDVVTFF